MKKESAVVSCWFSDLLNNTGMSTTQYIKENIPNSDFRLISQKDMDSHIYREIAFYDGDRKICHATNKVLKNKVVEDWCKNNPDEPFGRIFSDRNLKRVLISKTPVSRKYKITGEITAEIEEKFFPRS